MIKKARFINVWCNQISINFKFLDKLLYFKPLMATNQFSKGICNEAIFDHTELCHMSCVSVPYTVWSHRNHNFKKYLLT